jgi:hypothetical protein
VDRRSRLGYGVVAVAAPLAVMANPYGFGVVDYYRALIGNRTVHANILEWAPPTLGHRESIAFFVLLVAVPGILGYALAHGYRPPAVLVVGTAGLGLLASQGVRYQLWFGIVAATLAADALAAVRPAPPPFPRRVLCAFGAAAAASAVVGAVVLATTPATQFEYHVPRGAFTAVARYEATHPGARILADEHASALLWKHPELAGRVAYDTRLEQYSGPALVKWFSYLNVATPDWLAATKGYDVLVASRGDRPALVSRLSTLSGWRTLYADQDGAAFVRRAP